MPSQVLVQGAPLEAILTKYGYVLTRFSIRAHLSKLPSLVRVPGFRPRSSRADPERSSGGSAASEALAAVAIQVRSSLPRP